MVKLNAAVAVVFCVYMLLAVQSAAGGNGKGDDKKDVDVEDTVRTEVAKAIKKHPGVGPALVRLVFHDCWVKGCDGSVLLETTPFSSTSGNEKAAANNIGLAGFDVIDTIKGMVGDSLSCADIVVLAARDACGILSGGRITYVVDTGRKDGVVSSAAAADATLPHSTSEFKDLKSNFAKKNFTVEELVVLSGAHSIGVAHLSSFHDRLDNATATPISSKYKDALAADVKENPTEKNNIRDMSKAFRNAAGYDATGVNTAAPGALDNSFYHNNLQNMVLFKSDWVMLTDAEAAGDVEEFRDNATKWNKGFAAAMAKLSKLPAEGKHFEMRSSCRRTNKNSY